MGQTISNPPYNWSLGWSNQEGWPPFDLSKVVMRVFPLRANYHSLKLYCDRFINIAPEYSRFEPAAPFVLFCVINYGHMGNVASNHGFTSQNEVLFALPLNWYRKRQGKWELQRRASISPFIWVDEPASAWTGRNVFGWPKSMAWLSPGVNEWSKDPTAPRTLFTLSALMYRELFAGQRQEPGPLLEIEQQQPSALLDVPVNPLNPLNPLLAWPKGILKSLSLGADLLETITRLPAFGFPPWGKGTNILQMMRAQFGDFNPIGSLPAPNTINLKQFRDPSSPQSISYQALTNSEMTPTSFNRGGLLGEPGLIRGDLGGGYRIRVHKSPGWPIIESLGLEVAKEYQDQGSQVAVLEPVFPFWVDVDFEYGQGEVICWRTKNSHWAPPPGTEVEKAVDTTSPEQSVPNDFMCDKCESPHLYNTAEGAAVQQVYGPFQYPNATVRVLPMMADWNKLREFTDAYLNFPDGKEPGGKNAETEYDKDKDGNYYLRIWPGESDTWRGPEEKKPEDVPKYLHGLPMTGSTESNNLFVPWGRYVYMTITSYEDITSEMNIGWWARRRVTFSFPVKWYQWVDTKKKAEAEKGRKVAPYWQLKSFGMISPFMYVDTETAATVGREMQGWNAAQADINCPENDWLMGNGPIAAPDLMSLYTDVKPAVGANQKTKKGLLVEVTARDPVDSRDEEAWKEIASQWGERQVLEARAKAAEAKGTLDRTRWDRRRKLARLKSGAMEVLFRQVPINHLALKQFRDVQNPHEACLQAINVYPETIQRVHDLRAIDDPLYVAVHRYPTQPLVDLFGLDVKWTDTGQGQPVDYVQAVRPFWMRADISSDLGRDVLRRVGSTEWQDGDPIELYLDPEHKAAEGDTKDDLPATPALASVYADDHPAEVQDFGSDKLYLESVDESGRVWSGGWWKRRGGYRDLLLESRHTFSPQVAIESILNHRWANFGPKPEDEKKLDHPWATLIPNQSIRNKAARDHFLKEYGVPEPKPEGETQKDKQKSDFEVISNTEADGYWYVLPE